MRHIKDELWLCEVGIPCAQEMELNFVLDHDYGNEDELQMQLVLLFQTDETGSFKLMQALEKFPPCSERRQLDALIAAQLS
jgi:hypothetical protein